MATCSPRRGSSDTTGQSLPKAMCAPLDTQAVVDPRAARARLAEVGLPHVDLIGRRAAVVGLLRRDHARASRSAGCRQDRWSRCVRCGAGGRGQARDWPLAACSNASSADRMPRSPIAWMKICQPRLSSIATTRSSSACVKLIWPLVARLAYGSSIAAVCDSTTPSSISFTAPALSTGSSANSARSCLELGELRVGEPGGRGDRVVDAQVQRALLADLVVEREVVDADAGILNAGHALRVCERPSPVAAPRAVRPE